MYCGAICAPGKSRRWLVKFLGEPEHKCSLVQHFDDDVAWSIIFLRFFGLHLHEFYISGPDGCIVFC